MKYSSRQFLNPNGAFNETNKISIEGNHLVNPDTQDGVVGYYIIGSKGEYEKIIEKGIMPDTTTEPNTTTELDEYKNCIFFRLAKPEGYYVAVKLELDKNNPRVFNTQLRNSSKDIYEQGSHSYKETLEIMTDESSSQASPKSAQDLLRKAFCPEVPVKINKCIDPSMFYSHGYNNPKEPTTSFIRSYSENPLRGKGPTTGPRSRSADTLSTSGSSSGSNYGNKPADTTRPDPGPTENNQRSSEASTRSASLSKRLSDIFGGKKKR